MEKFLIGAENFLVLIKNNWTAIVVCAAIVFVIYKKCVAFFSKSEDEQIALAKEIIANTMLNYVSKAEQNYSEWVKAGAAKRAEVISAIFADFPILQKVVNQEGLISWIDVTINDALKLMREMIAEKAAQ